MRSFVRREFLGSTREDDERNWRMHKSTSLGIPPWHPPGHSRRLKRLIWASPLLHRQASGRLRWNYVFITLHVMCYSWSVSVLFVCLLVLNLLDPRYLVWERDTLRFFIRILVCFVYLLLSILNFCFSYQLLCFPYIFLRAISCCY